MHHSAPSPAPRRRRARGTRAARGTLAAAALLAALAPAPALAAGGWSPASEAVADGPAGAEVEVGMRMRSDLALDRAGTATLAWAQSDDQSTMWTDPAVQSVRVSRRPAGASWQTPQEIASVARAASSNYTVIVGPKVAVDGAGRATVAWGERTAADSVTVRAATAAADGSWSAPATLATVTAPSTSFTIAVDVAADGDAAIAWQGAAAVELATRAGAAGAWSAPQTVDATTVDIADTIGLGRDQDDALTIVWRTGADNATREIKTRTRAAGGGLGAVATLTTAAGFASRPAVAVDAAGAAVATWGSDAGPRAAARPAGSSAVWTPPAVLASGSANAATTQTGAPARITGGTGIPSAAFDAHGTATVVWPEAADAGAGTPSRVRAQRFGNDGSWGAAETVAEEATAANPAVWPRIALGPDGAATVAWTSRVAPSFSGGVVVLSGGEIRVANRAAGETAWSAPVTYTNPTPTYGNTTALGLPDDANLTLAGDPLGNAALGWTPYAAAAAPAARTNESARFEASVAPRLDWTARGLTGSSNLRTWVNYLYTAWPGPGPTTARGVQTSDGASQPDAGDRSSWRLTQQDAYRDPASGKLVIQYRGTIRWVNTAHYIDSTLVDPRLEIAADERSARVYVDGQASGSMADAMAGNPRTIPVSNVRLLDVDLSGAAPRTSGDGSVRSWVAVPARASAAGTSTYGLETYAGQPFGFLTFTIPTAIEPRTDPPEEEPGQPTQPDTPQAPPAPSAPTVPSVPAPSVRAPVSPAATRRITAAIRGSKKAKRQVVLTLSGQVGRRSSQTYRVVLRRGKTVMASGTLRGRTLRLSAAVVKRQKGGKVSYRKLSGRYTLASPARHAGRKLAGARRIAAVTVTVR
ncbi:HtaA domain-containing protein [Conexibacter sp. CPCC 206217]|uniref:HtaA domain-containing protein n=1 Tax=Conexibacter sp. CPCC 206217 TaxID=3064574 RepID=UPI002721B3DD|nr:HtaA domain-containing protein [Conexibacter sp. CPCC 206217]MDO8213046.1 HtaA domain-containing protein [Conexibacter sp. CPCC 206217]